MKSEKIIRVSEVQGDDEIRFKNQLKYHKVMAAIPMSGRKTLIVIPGYDNFLLNDTTVIYRKI